MAAALSVALVSCAGSAAPEALLPGAEFGLQILGVELLADGDIARLNYRVVEYDAARRALDQTVRLQAAGTEGILDVMQAGRLGPLRQRPSRTGKKQFILFPNNGRPLVHGGKATLLIGASRITDIPVS